MGRVDLTTPDRPRFSWSGTGFVARFTGTGMDAQLLNSGNPLRFRAVIDGKPQQPFTARSGGSTYPLARGLTSGEHTVALYRETEGSQGDSQLMGLTVQGGTLLSPPAAATRFIELIGDSISAGFGNLGRLEDSDCFATQSHWDTYGAIAARALDAELSTIAVSGYGAYRDYGGSNEGTLERVYERARTNAATPLWSFARAPQAVVVNLGTNDVAKGDPGPPFRDAYRKLLRTIRAKYPHAVILCTLGPMLTDPSRATMQAHVQAAVDAQIAAGDEKLSTYFFAPQTADKFGCAYHPNAAEHTLMAKLLVAELRPLLGW